MRLCLVGPTYPFRGGISHYTTVLCRELRLRHDVHFVSLRKQYPRLLFPGRTQADGSREILAVDNDPLLSPLNPWSWERARRKILDVRPDLVLFQWWHPFFAPCFGTLARRIARSGIRVALLVHNAEAHEGSALGRVLTRYALGSAHAFLAHSEADGKRLRRLHPGIPVRISPHPTYDCFDADSAPSTESARRVLGLPEGGTTLLFFGHVRRYKGLLDLIRAMPRILRVRDCRLVVAGEFYHQRKETLALIRDLGLEDRIHLADRYVPNEEVRLWFGAADLVVLPYRSASQSGVAQIAFAFRRPVVATRVGGLPEVVEDGVTGFLAPPADPSALAETVLRFFREEAGPRMAENIGRQDARFGWDKMVELVEAIATGDRPIGSPAEPAGATTIR